MAVDRTIEFSVPLLCHKCGRTGLAIYEESERPSDRSGSHPYDDRKLVGIEGQFRAEAGNDRLIYCECGERVR